MIDLNHMSVLIVDDMESMCKSIRGMLKVLKYGKKFRFAYNGREALEILKEKTIDLVIADWNMPLMTGLELLVHIRKDKQLRDLPVVMVTAEAGRDIVAEAAESDVDAYILKPLTVKSLGDKISFVIKKVNNPPPMFYHLKRARNFKEVGHLNAAIEEIHLAIKADPLSSKPLRELGYLFLSENEWGQAEKYFLKAAELNPYDVFALHYLGELYLKQNRIEKAAIYFDKAIRISPRHISRCLDYGKILLEKGMIRKARKVFEEVLGYSDNPLSLSEEIAEVFMQKGIYADAVKLMNTVLKSVPARYDLLFKLGIAYENLGRHKKALNFFIQSGNKDKDNLAAKIHIAKNYFALNQIPKAEQILRSVLRIDPNNQDAKELLSHCI